MNSTPEGRGLPALPINTGMMPPTWVVGIDYSMQCPALSFIETDKPFCLSNCKMYYLSDKLPKESLVNIQGSRLTKYSTQEERFDLISNWAIETIQKVVGPDTMAVFIEDYSFGSKGMVFHIAENVGLVKHKMWKLGYPITLLPPSVIKKFATSKGNADKNRMYEVFVAETCTNLMSVFQPKAKSVGSPVGDLVDSYYIAKVGHASFR